MKEPNTPAAPPATASRTTRSARRTAGAVCTYRVAPEVDRIIRETLGRRPAECGAVLGGSRRKRTVTAIHLDGSARTNGSAYSPDVAAVNRVLAQWEEQGIEFLGFVHSHPPGIVAPSWGDEEYAARILGALPGLDQMLMPIVQSEADTGRYALHAYVAQRRDGPLESALAQATARPLVQIAAAQWRIDQRLIDAVRISGDFDSPSTRVSDALGDQLQMRVRTAFDLARQAVTRLVVVGVGGARSLVEDLARTWVGEMVLIDPDVSSLPNVSTQAAAVADNGRFKVDCLAERVRAIHPRCHVHALPLAAESIDEARWETLLTAEGPIEQVVLLGMTDRFETQAFVNRLALNFAVPSVCAQMYEAGAGFEITFTHPEVTPACHRCALSSRYEHYLQRGFRNTTTSNGTAYPAVSLFNGAIAYVTLAVMQHGSAHPFWGRLLGRLGNRNLLVARLDPEFPLPPVERSFAACDPTRLPLFHFAWSPQPGDHPRHGFPQCPDCGGLGRLGELRGRFRGRLLEMAQAWEPPAPNDHPEALRRSRRSPVEPEDAITA